MFESIGVDIERRHRGFFGFFIINMGTSLSHWVRAGQPGYGNAPDPEVYPRIDYRTITGVEA